MLPSCDCEVSTADVIRQPWEKNGKSGVILKQAVYVKLPWEKYPVQFIVMLSKDAKPYPMGRYTTVPQSQMNQYGDVLEIAVRQLTPVIPAKPA